MTKRLIVWLDEEGKREEEIEKVVVEEDFIPERLRLSMESIDKWCPNLLASTIIFA